MGGEALHMHQNLYACLKVGRLDRASMILEKLTLVYQPSAPELVDAHNIYFATLFETMQQEPEPAADSMAKLERWYASKMVARGVAPIALTFVTLLRAAVNFLEGDAQDAAIRKYITEAKAVHVLDEVNESEDFWDEEWDVILRAQPDDYHPPPLVADLQESLVNTPAARRSLAEHGLVPEQVTQKLKFEIASVKQKGLGLEALRQSLAVFHDAERVAYPHDMAGTQEEKDHAYAYLRQVRVEQDALDAAVHRWQQEDDKLQDMGIHGVMNTKPIQAIMSNWHSTLVPHFKKHIARCKEVLTEPSKDNAKEGGHVYGPWMERMSPEKLAALTISRIVTAGVGGKSAGPNSWKVTKLANMLGNDFMNLLNSDAQARRDAFLKKQRKQMRAQLIDKLHKTQPDPERQTSQLPNYTAYYEKETAPLPVRIRMGVFALELVVKYCTLVNTVRDPKSGKTLTSNQAAFLHRVGHSNGKKVGFIVPHHRLLEKLRDENVQHVTAVNLPMIIQPKPWSSFQDGGYYTLPQRVVRLKNEDPDQKAYAQSAIDTGDMKKVLAGLDVLGKVPWQINAPVLKVMAQAWNSGETVGKLVQSTDTLEPPAEPPADATSLERVKHSKKLQEFNNLKSGLHSQRCFQNFQLELAAAFANEKNIYFPHNVDFRGRAYPIPPILNHLGADLARGLLKFGHAKELGTVGLQWLKIHLANLYGFDKASLTEREQFAMDNINEIYDSATNPLDGRRWWANAEDPWQCLACCMELKSAFDSPDPTRYKSQLPVHQDGTCNGLQHYAALGGDLAGARQVNLEPSDRPQDIYTGVAELVKEMVAKEAEQGLPLASFINGHISRKVVKRTVMTNVYGVTFMGAKAQVEEQLRSLFPNFQETKQVKNLTSVALYVAFKIFEALGKIFNGAQEIQYWLGECGHRITSSLDADQVKHIQAKFEGRQLAQDPKFKTPKVPSARATAKAIKAIASLKTSIIWTTPLKMPIVQPYKKDATTTIKTKLQDISIIRRGGADPVDKRKQLQAFPPNFIHSLDATHMTLSALKCSEMGLDFAAVHDSFWTHACDIPNLNVILRDAFVRMHSEDVIGRLAEEFKARYSGAMYCASIYSQSVAGTKIKEWRVKLLHGRGERVNKIYHHQEATTEELALESRRQELLASEDPEEVKQGEQMVTPTSIWLEHQDPKAMSSFRMNLLGETKDKKSSKATYERTREKVLDHEAEVLAETKHGKSDDDTIATHEDGIDAIATEEIFASKTPDTTTGFDPTDNTADGIDPAAITEDVAEADADEEEESGRSRLMSKGKISLKQSMTVWAPLSFPPVPKKGGWDVSRLRESTYFFS